MTTEGNTSVQPVYTRESCHPSLSGSSKKYNPYTNYLASPTCTKAAEHSRPSTSRSQANLRRCHRSRLCSFSVAHHTSMLLPVLGQRLQLLWGQRVRLRSRRRQGAAQPKQNATEGAAGHTPSGTSSSMTGLAACELEPNTQQLCFW